MTVLKPAHAYLLDCAIDKMNTQTLRFVHALQPSVPENVQPAEMVEGTTTEEVLRVLIHRHETFQEGPYASPDNKLVIRCLLDALQFQSEIIARHASQ